MVAATPPAIKVAAVTHNTLVSPDEQSSFSAAPPKIPNNPAAAPVIAKVSPIRSRFIAF